MKFEILKFIYDGKVLITLFIFLTFTLLAIKEKVLFVRLNISLNVLFIILFASFVFIEQNIEYDAFYVADPLDFAKWAHEILYKHSYKFIGFLVYFSVNLFVIYKKVFFAKVEGKPE